MKKAISLTLCFMLLVQIIGVAGISVYAESNASSILYQDSFSNYDGFSNYLYDETGAFETEYLADTADNYGYINATAPTVSGNALSFAKGDGIRLNWQKLPGFATFDANKTYTFTFDVKVTNFGNNAHLTGLTGSDREFYFAPGGYYNQIEFRNATNVSTNTVGIRAGDSWNTNSSAYTLNTLYTCIVEWKPANKSITSTIKNGDIVVVTGTRTNDSYGTVNKYTRSFAFRCEDGTAILDNILFTDGTNRYYQTFDPAEDQSTAFYNYSGAFEREYKADTADDYGYVETNKPSVVNNALSFAKGDGLRFNWQKLPGFATFDANKTYTFSFDVKVTNFGNNAHLPGLTGSDREFYFAPGGYYNQIEFRNATNVGNTLGIRAGDSWNNNLSAYTLNTVYSCTVVWKPSNKTITSTIKNGNTVVVTGTRTNDGYATLNKYTRSFAWRCEDGSMTLDNIVFTDGTNTYSENFRTDSAMTNNGVWGLETVQKSDATAPVLKNGVVNMGEKNGFTFNWQKVPSVGEFNSTNIYTFEFDAKITDKGDGSTWGADNYTRALYVAFGGWFNLVELPHKDGTATLCGSSSTAFDESKFLNTDLHITINWEGRNAHASIADESGNILLSGSRSSADFVNMTANQGAMTNIVFRCEDGSAQIDNFSFSVTKSQKLSNNTLSIPQNKQAIYSGEYNFDGNNPVSVRFGDAELFYVSQSGIIVGGKAIASDIPVGNYTVKADINPTQELVSVEAVYPDGSVVRRGFFTLLGGNAIEVFSTSSDALLAENVVYADITLNDYTLTTTEPTATGFGANVYNLITSFDDAKTTRNFAWTAKTAFAGSSTMAVQYRVAGSETWSEVSAIKEVEKLDTTDEDFYKCDVTGLTANTTYEYRIGIKGSTDYTNKWSKIYTFTTSANGVDDFSFIAIGDTQGITWDGTTVPYKGFMYAKSAIEEAYQEVPNPAFMLHTGDVVETASNRNYWNMYFKALGEYGATTPNFVTMGNHDTMVAGDHTYFDLHFNHPNNGGTAVLDKNEIAKITDANLKYTVENSDETIYSYNYGNAHFIVLNTGNYTSDDQYLLEAQRQWLINDLEANRDVKWTVMLIHEPVYHRVGGEESRPTLADTIEGYGVDLVIQGHSHLVTRTYPMKDGKIVSKAVTDNIKKGTGTVYTTIGSTALNHDGINDTVNIEEMFSITIPELTQAAYTTVSVNNNELVVTTKQINGLVLDAFTIESEEPVDEGALAAQAVAEKIDAIGEITEENYLDKEQAIVEAETALSELIATYGEDAADSIADSVLVLEDARETYEYYVGKVAVDKAMAQVVMSKIDAIENFDEDATLDARVAYENLTDVQKSYVTNLQKLEEIEAALKDLVYGDINGDKVVTVKDALKTLQYSTGKITFTPIQVKAADVGSLYGEIDATDALLILQYSIGKIDTFEVQK